MSSNMFIDALVSKTQYYYNILTAHLISCLPMSLVTRPYSMTVNFLSLESTDDVSGGDRQGNTKISITVSSEPNDRIIIHEFDECSNHVCTLLFIIVDIVTSIYDALFSLSQ